MIVERCIYPVFIEIVFNAQQMDNNKQLEER